MQRYVEFGIDVYGYVTLTTPSNKGLWDDMKRFVDSLQAIHPNLPLRVIPLEICDFTPLVKRLREEHHVAMRNQHVAVAAWQDELNDRFAAHYLSCNIADVPLGN